MGTLVPFRQFVLKVHSRCDLACDHCYVYEHADQSWRARPRAMAPATAAQAVARIAEHARAHRLRWVSVVLHGGEPLLAGPARLAATIAALREGLAGVCELELRIHTNGVLLDERFCALFREQRVRIGISLDGDQAGNDRHRRFADGRSSYSYVIRAIEIVRRQVPELFSGLLCTIDVRNDPIAVYTELLAHRPPAIDFLLPHATWDHPPDRPSPTAYADWLTVIFDRWLADGRPVPVRMFDSIARTSRDGSSLTESLGLEPSDLVVIETDGALEQVDSLKTAYDGAPATGFNIFANTLDEVARHPAIAARQSGRAGLAAECQQCPVMSSCGGGLYAHRYRAGSGFENPSVYCADLMKLIVHIRRNLTQPVHVIPAATMDELASGYGAAEAIMTLRESQRSLQRALLASIPVNAATAAACSVIDQVDQQRRDCLNDVLAYPYVRVWATRCLRGQAEQRELSAIAAVAAIRAGLEAQLELPVRAGLVHLPMIGSWLVAKSTDTARIDIAGGAFQLPPGSTPLPLRRLEAGPGTIVLDDLDPFRDCYEWPAASRLDDAEIDAWQRTFQAAWALIERDYACYASGLAEGLSAIVPLAPPERGRQVSATARDAFGSVAIALPADPAVLALLLIHEFQHVKLGAVLDLLDLHDPADTGRYYAPWREDPRPWQGLLQGAYAHIAVTDYWRVRRTVLAGDAESTAATAAFAQRRQETMAAIDSLSRSGTLTNVGRRFVDGMRATVSGWLNEPVPDAAQRMAADAMRCHRDTWLLVNGPESTGAGD
jgi:uncharacterized protein